MRITRRRFLHGASALGATLLLPPGCSSGKKRSPAGGPYLQDVRGDRATVAAVTSSSERLVVRIAPADGSAPERVVEDPDPVQVHGLVASGLTAGTAYRYRLERANGALIGESTFTTAPAAGSGTRVSFVAFGDSGGTDASGGIEGMGQELSGSFGGTAPGDENQQHRVAAAIAARSAPDLVLHTGDVVYPDGAAEDYSEALFRPFAGLIAAAPIYPVLGNHDAKAARGQPFLENFFLPAGGPFADRRAYSFDRGDAHFTCLDVETSPAEPGSEQLAWLEEDLARSTATWKVVTFHEPPHSPRHGQDNEAMLDGIVPVLERAKVDLVLCGHDHVYGRYLPIGGITYVVTGGGGKSLYGVQADERLAYAEGVFHYVEGVIEGRELRLRAIDATGTPFDSTILRK